MLLRSSPLLLREGGHHQRPGKASSAVVACLACSAASRRVKARQLRAVRVLYAGSLLLLMAYVGSRFVLEVILVRPS